MFFVLFVSYFEKKKLEKIKSFKKEKKEKSFKKYDVQKNICTLPQQTQQGS